LQGSQGLKPYQSILSAGESEIVIQKSRFLGYFLPVSSEEEAQEALTKIRKQHYDARHCCYAYRVRAGNVVRSSDDGEPSGTAGAPILSVLTGAGVDDVLCAVVRYFGGVLLGTGGLVRAYGKSASEALAATKITQMIVCRRIQITISYAAFHVVEPSIRAHRYPFQAEYGELVTLSLLLPEEETDQFSAWITDRTDGSAKIEVLEQSLTPFEKTNDEIKNV